MNKQLSKAKLKAKQKFGSSENKQKLGLSEKGTWLAGLQEALAAALDGAPMKTSLGLLVRSAIKQLGSEARAGFYLANPERTAIYHIVGMPADYAEAVDGFKVGPDSLACGLATHTGQPIITPDVTKEPLWQPWLWMAEKFGYRACWSFPIHTAAGTFVGTFAIYWPQPREATTRDKEFAATVTQAAGIIIARHMDAEIRSSTKEALRESQAQLQAELDDSKLLQSISAELAVEGNDEALYEKIVAAATSIMRSQFGTIHMYYPERGGKKELLLLASRGFKPETTAHWQWVNADSGCTCGHVLKTGSRAIAKDVETCEFLKGTPVRDVLLKAGIRAAQSTPLISRSGVLVGMISTHWDRPHRPTERDLRLLDIVARQAADLIERKKAEQELRKSEECFRAFTQATFDVVYRMSPDWTEMRHLRGREFISDTLEPSRTWLNKYIYPEDQQHVLGVIQRAIQSKSIFELEHRVIQMDGKIGWTHSRAIPIFDNDGEILEWFGAARDVTQRKRAEETQQLLLNELNHRVKNTLAIVQAIAQRTSARTHDPADFAKSFGGRIQSLARVHTLLSDTNWQGADLRDLIRDQLLSAAADESRMTAWGPAVRLDPQLALHLALMLHELGTNSTKYGALSAASGSVTVSWTTDDALHLRWVERGGPQVRTPSKLGFGTTLIEQSAKGQGGDARMMYEAEGITWNITLPLRDRSTFGIVPRMAAAPVFAPDSQLTDTTSPNLSGRRFLVVEDEPLIGLDIVAALEESQAQVEGPVATAVKAIEIIERISLDGALLDANLHGRPVDEIASALMRRKVPFVFVTGHGRDGLPESFRKVAILTKPCSHQQVIDAAAQLVTTRHDVVRLRN